MKVNTRTEGDVAVAVVAGDVDGTTAPRLEEQLLTLVAPHRHLVIDVQGVKYMSSAGLRTLLSVYKRVSAGKGKVALAGLSKQTRDVMAMTGLLGFFLLTETPEEGISALQLRR